MKKTSKFVTAFMAVVALLAMTLQMNGCKPQEIPSLYDPNWKSLPQPIVDSLSPSFSLGGVGTLTVYGKNFSTKVDSEGVFFNSTLATLVSGTSTRIVLKTPNVTGDSVQVRVYVIGAADFSPTILYKMLPAISPFGTLLGNLPGVLTTDSAGNSYVNLKTKAGVGQGTYKFTPNGSSTAFETSTNIWSGIKVGPGGYLYLARNLAAVFRVGPGGGAAALWVKTPGKVTDMDFDQNGVLWTGGNGTAIYSINQASVVKSFPFPANIHAVKVYGADLYVAAGIDSSEAVWKFPILASGDLGTPQKYFDFSAVYGYNTYSPLAMAFSQGGDLYIGTDAPDAIVIVHADGSHEPLYPGVFAPTVQSLSWGSGTNLYISTTSGLFLVVAPASGAPNYGAQ